MNQDMTIKIRVDGAEQANSKVSGLDKIIGGVAKTLAAVGAAALVAGKAFDFAKKAAQAMESQNLAIKKLNTTLKSTGKNAQYTSEELQNLSSELQWVSGFGDEDILANATASIMRFGDMSKETFKKAQELTLDLGTEMGSLQAASKLVGLALQDPILGLTRLRRAGVAFSQSQQAVIKNFVETGQKAKAQEAIINALNEKFGGLAKSQLTATTLLKNAWGDYLEFVGRQTMPIFDGVKMGMAIFFKGITDQAGAVSQDMQTAWIDSAIGISRTTAKTLSVAKTAVAALGGVAVSIWAIVSNTIYSIMATLNSALGSIAWFFRDFLDAVGRSVMGLELGPIVEAIDNLKSTWDPAKNTIVTGANEIVKVFENWKALLPNARREFEIIDSNANALAKTMKDGLGSAASGLGNDLNSLLENLNASLGKEGGANDAKEALNELIDAMRKFNNEANKKTDFALLTSFRESLSEVKRFVDGINNALRAGVATTYQGWDFISLLGSGVTKDLSAITNQVSDAVSAMYDESENNAEQAVRTKYAKMREINDAYALGVQSLIHEITAAQSDLLAAGMSASALDSVIASLTANMDRITGANKRLIEKEQLELAGLATQAAEKNIETEFELVKSLGATWEQYYSYKSQLLNNEYAEWIAQGVNKEIADKALSEKLKGIAKEYADYISSDAVAVDPFQAWLDKRDVFRDQIEGMVNEIVSAFGRMATEGQSFTDAMQQAFKSWVSSAISEIARLMARMVALFVLRSIFNAVTPGGGAVTNFGSIAKEVIFGSVAGSAPAAAPMSITPSLVNPLPPVSGDAGLMRLVKEVQGLREDVYASQPTVVRMDWRKGEMSQAVDNDRKYRLVMGT